MRPFICSLAVFLLLSASTAAFAQKPPSDAPAAKEPKKPVEDEKASAAKCEQHGVKKSICARCNPKLEKVFKSKGDWCAEHKRPESQCVLCHPDLAKDGVK